MRRDCWFLALPTACKLKWRRRRKQEGLQRSWRQEEDDEEGRGEIQLKGRKKERKKERMLGTRHKDETTLPNE